MKIKVLIVDDEPLAREVITSYLSDFSEVSEMQEAANGLEAIEKVNSMDPDLIFLDIEMPKMNGIAVMESEQIPNHSKIIFTTAYNQYAIKAFDLNAIDYLLKPFDRDRFHKTMIRALENIKLNRMGDSQIQLMKFQLDYENQSLVSSTGSFPKKLVVRDSKRIKHINVDDVILIQASGDYIEIIDLNGKFMLYKSISQIEKSLNPEVFRRIHKSTIINCERITEIRPLKNSEYFFYLDNEEKAKSGRTYKEQILDLVKGNI